MELCMVVICHTGNDDHSIPEGDGAKENNSEKIKDTSSEKNYHINSDWREVRAKFIRGEQVMFYFSKWLICSENFLLAK